MNPIFQQAIWFSENNKLCLNLAGMRNDGAKLILTSWNHASGITWSLQTDNSVEHHDDPFTAPYFPIGECLDYDSCKNYLEQIPAALQSQLIHYRSKSFGLMMLLSQHPFLTTLYVKYPTLFWLVFKQAQAQHWTKPQFVNVCDQGEMAILKVCQLPANDVALNIIAKFAAEQFGQTQYDLIMRLFAELDYSHLNALRDHLPDHLIQFLLRYPNLQHAKLIQSLDKTDYNELLQIVQNLSAEVTDTRTLTELITESESIPALKSHYGRLEATLAAQELHSYEKTLGEAQSTSRAFPQLSLFADRDELQQILSEAELLKESKLFQHNFMPYVEGIVKGRYAIYKILKPEKAILLLMLFPTRDGGIIPVIKTLVPYRSQIDIRQTFAWLNDITGLSLNTMS